MGIVAARLMIEEDEDRPLDEAQPSQRPHGLEIPEGFVPATKAQIAHWRQVCGAISERGPRGMGTPTGRLTSHPPASPCTRWRSGD